MRKSIILAILLSATYALAAEIPIKINVMEKCGDDPISGTRVALVGETIKLPAGTGLLDAGGKAVKTKNGEVTLRTPGLYTLVSACGNTTIMTETSKRIKAAENSGEKGNGKQLALWGILALTTALSAILVWKR